MHTKLDTPPDQLEDEDHDFLADIREHGWFDTAIQADAEGPGFSFTTGFWLNARFPEVIVFGLAHRLAHEILWDLFRDAQAGNPPRTHAPVPNILGNHDACLFPVSRAQYPEYLGWSGWFYGNDDFPCLQLVWPDAAGVFPWQEGFDESMRDDQPDLTENGWAASLIAGGASAPSR